MSFLLTSDCGELINADGSSFIQTDASWRFPLAFQLFFAVFIALSAFWLPESPRWLISRDKHEKALTIMVALEGGDATPDSAVVKADFEEISTSIALEKSPESKRKTMPRFRLILGVGAQAMQQLTGINIICYYLPYVLTQSVGLDGATARLLAAVNAVTYLLSTLIGLYFIEKWGRRRLLMIGALGQCCCWLAITALLNLAEDAIEGSLREKSLGSGSVAFFFLFNIFFGAGWQGVSWLYPTEINSTQNRIQGMSYGVATNWLINFGVVFVTPIGIAKLGSQFYVIWTVLNAFIIPVIYLFYPETAGRSLEDIDGMFEDNNTIWVGFNKGMTTCRPPPRVIHDPENVGVEMVKVPPADSATGSKTDKACPATVLDFSDNSMRERHLPETTGAAREQKTSESDEQAPDGVSDMTGSSQETTTPLMSRCASTTALDKTFGLTSGPGP